MSPVGWGWAGTVGAVPIPPGPLTTGTWTVLASRLSRPSGTGLALIVRLHLVGPDGSDEAFNARTFARTAHDLTQRPAWWGALAVVAAHRLEHVLRSGQRDISPGGGLPIVDVAFPLVDSIGVELLVGAAGVPVLRVGISRVIQRG